MDQRETSLILHSKKHRHLYPASTFPLTHLADRQNLARHSLRQSASLYSARLFFRWLLGLILLNCLSFQNHLHVYNYSSGPFHVNREDCLERESVGHFPSTKVSTQLARSFVWEYSLGVDS